MRLLRILFILLMFTICLNCGQESGDFSPVTGGIDPADFHFSYNSLIGHWQQVDSGGYTYNNYWIFETNGGFFVAEYYDDDELHAEYCYTYTVDDNSFVVHTPEGDDYFYFSVNEDRLTLNVQGYVFYFNRVDPAPYVEDCFNR